MLRSYINFMTFALFASSFEKSLKNVTPECFNRGPSEFRLDSRQKYEGMTTPREIAPFILCRRA